MDSFYAFFVVIFASLFFSTILKKVHVPWVVALIFTGIIIGPSVFNVIEVDSVLKFLGALGLTFLMFNAGLETKPDAFKKAGKNIFLISFINAVIPFGFGFWIASIFDYGYFASFLIGIVFISSSLSAVIPSLEIGGLMNQKIGQTIIASNMVQDIGSLLLMSVLLQNTGASSNTNIVVLFLVLLIVFVSFKKILPWFIKLSFAGQDPKKDFYEEEIRLILFVLFGTVIVFQLLGLHPIISGFVVGLILSGTIKSKIIHEKISALGYGIFIPIFFVTVGLETDISIFLNANAVSIFSIFAVIFGSIFAKFSSGYIGARILHFTQNESLLYASASTPQLSTTLAVAFTGLSLGIIDQTMITSLVFLSVFSVVLGPILMEIFIGRIKKDIAAGEVGEIGENNVSFIEEVIPQ